MAEQLPFGTDSFADNPEPRCPCVLLLDVSGSMRGEPVAQLNAGLQAYRDELASDALAAKRVEVAVVTFGGEINVVCEFCTAANFQAPTLMAEGDTPMGAAINKAVDMIAERKQAYKDAGIAFYRPWIFLITDGAPTDRWADAAQRVAQGEASRSFIFFAVGVENADFSVLAQISAVREPLKLKGLQFRDLFQWLSNSQRSVSRSKPEDKLALPSPQGWAQIDT